MALVLPQSVTMSRDEVPSYSLPPGFPESTSSRMVWTGADLADERQYVYQLTAADLLEIDAALNTFKEYELDGDLADTENFPLPNLRHTLERLRDEVYNGIGLFLIRGLKPELYSVEDSMVIFMGLQGYIAEQKARQDDQGNMLVHIISDSTPNTSTERAMHARHSKKSIAFHTEATGDLLAWQTRSTAASGGRCIVASSHTIYNVLAATCPDMIHTLARPDWPFAYPTLHYRPILYHLDSRLIINFSPSALLGSAAHPRPDTLPKLSAAQRTALAALQAIATATQLEIATLPGDLHFINNLALLHRRSAFEDHADAAQGARRHLVRMRLRSAEKGWRIPRELEGAWEEAFGEAGERAWHLSPMPEGFFPLRKFPE